MHLDTDIFTRKGKFLMLALYHRGTFRKLLNKDNPDAVTQEEVVATKQSIIRAVESLFSGYLIDPASLLRRSDLERSDLYRRVAAPYLLCIEKTGYTDMGSMELGRAGERKTELEYTVAQLKEMGARGIKILLYVHPDASVTDYQINLARTVLADSHTYSVPFFLELVTYPLLNKTNHKPEIVIHSLQKFVDAGIVPDVFKLEYPGDAASCFKISSILKKTPWILLTKGDNFDLFREELKQAIQNGCSGFLAGRALWQEFALYKTPQEREVFFKNVLHERFQEIVDIVLH